MTFEAGTELDQYPLVEKIGEGGMGFVWKARDISLDRDVAIKVLPKSRASDESFLARFERGDTAGRVVFSSPILRRKARERANWER